MATQDNEPQTNPWIPLPEDTTADIPPLVRSKSETTPEAAVRKIINVFVMVLIAVIVWSAVYSYVRAGKTTGAAPATTEHTAARAPSFLVGAVYNIGDGVRLYVVNNSSRTVSVLSGDAQTEGPDFMHRNTSFVIKYIDPGRSGGNLIAQAQLAEGRVLLSPHDKVIIRSLSVCQLGGTYYRGCGKFFGVDPDSPVHVVLKLDR